MRKLKEIKQYKAAAAALEPDLPTVRLSTALVAIVGNKTGMLISESVLNRVLSEKLEEVSATIRETLLTYIFEQIAERLTDARGELLSELKEIGEAAE